MIIRYLLVFSFAIPLILSFLNIGCAKKQLRINERSQESTTFQTTATGDTEDIRKSSASFSQVELLKIQNARDAQKNQDNNFNSLNILSQAILEEAFEEIRNRSIIPVLATHKTPKPVGSYGEIIRQVLKKDSYSQYLSPKEYSSFKLQLSGGKYAGVGMHISQDRNGSIIAEPMTKSPAERAGIKNGDRIVAINAIPIQGRTLIEVGSRIRGTVGSSVNITYQSNNLPAETVTIRREKFIDRTVSQEKDRNLSQFLKIDSSQSTYLHISSFDQHTDDQFFQIMSNLPEKTPIIIDLRGNSGGDFRIAMKIADSFLVPRTVLSYIVSRNSTEIVESKSGKKFKNPITILQDSRTASAAESFVAAMVENKRAISVGEQTFGKARLQTFAELSDGSAILLTTAKLLTPSQYDFDKIGIAPSKLISSKS